MSSETRKKPSTRSYEFFVTTSEPQQPAGSDRNRIRHLVMRNFFEKKALDGVKVGNEESEDRSRETVRERERGGLRGRFRVDGTGKGGGKRKGAGEVCLLFSFVVCGLRQ